MKKTFVLLAGLVVTVSALVGGCASSADRSATDPLIGTWRGREAPTDSAFEFASVTFAPDGTYTAQLRYDGDVRADSGRWSYEGETLTIGEGDRRYTAKVRGNELTVTEPRSRTTVTLDRLR